MVVGNENRVHLHPVPNTNTKFSIIISLIRLAIVDIVKVELVHLRVAILTGTFLIVPCIEEPIRYALLLVFGVVSQGWG